MLVVDLRDILEGKLYDIIGSSDSAIVDIILGRNQDR